MDIFLMVLRVLMLTVGSLMGIVYLAVQIWRPVDAEGISFKGRDYFFYAVVAFLFGFGMNNEWGLLAFAPLFFVHICFQFFVRKNKVRGGGRWMEIQWTKLTPKGFQLPQEMKRELGKLPGDVHFLFPRFASLLALRFIVRSVKKNSSKVPVRYNAKQADALGMIESTAKNIKGLDSGKTEKMSLPFGVLKVTRL